MPTENNEQNKRLDLIEYRLKQVENKTTKLCSKISNFLGNHFVDLKSVVQKNADDLTWLKKFFWIIMTTSIGGLIASIINLL